MSTGLPISVTSARRGSASRSYYKLDLDIQRWVGWGVGWGEVGWLWTYSGGWAGRGGRPPCHTAGGG